MSLFSRFLAKLSSRRIWRSDTAILVYLGFAKLVIHLLTSTGYGYMGDEFYWLAMGQHLDFGYVDVPPLVAYLNALSRAIFGASLFANHLLPAIAGAVMVFFAGRLAREMGGGRFAQWFTALIILLAPAWLSINSFFAYDPFDQLMVLLLLYQTALILKAEPSTGVCARHWLGLGLIAGLGVMTKLSMLFMLGVLALALLLSPGHKSTGRKSFLTMWPWLAAVIGIGLCTPYIIWQVGHGWPLLTYWQNYARERPHPPTAQFLEQLVHFLNPWTLPVWLLGLFYLLFHREGKTYRALGLVFLFLLIGFTGVMKLEPRMLVSACFPLIAAGAVALERGARWLRREGKSRFIRWLKPVYIVTLVISGTMLAPFSLAVLPADTYIKYLNATPGFIKRNLFYYGNELPMTFSFRFGWPEMVKEVAAIYNSLPETDRKNCVIWTVSYADAGAIDLLGEEYGLPKAISNHLSYQFWGTGPAAATDSVVAIMVGAGPVPPNWIFQEVTQAALIKGHPYAVYWTRFQPVYVCRKPIRPLGEVWSRYAWFH